jgi:hypothetical protein
MRHRCAQTLLFLALMVTGLTTVHAHDLEVVAEVLTPAVDAQPRQAVSLRVRFTNTGTTWRTVVSSLRVPVGWVVVVPPAEVTLAPGEVHVALLTVLVAPDAAAGPYTFPMAYRTATSAPAREALFTIRVPAIDRVTLALVDAPAFVPATAPHRVEFLLGNTGNTAHEWDLTASSSLRLPVTLTPDTATLGPGERTMIVALVAAPERLTQQQTHALTVTAASRSVPDVRATARATIVLVPTNLSVASALHTFPLTLSVTYRVEPFVAEAAHPRLAIELSGSGTLHEHDPGLLVVHLRMTPTKLLERVTLDVEHPRWGVRLGHQDFAPSPLSSKVSGFGVRASATWSLGGTAPLRAELARYMVDNEARYAVAATAALARGVQVSATLSGGSGSLLGTFEIRYAPLRRDAARIQLTALDAIYGLRVDRDIQVAQALRVAGQVNDGASFGRVTYDTAASTFDGRDRHHASLHVAATRRLNDALSVEADYPLNLVLGYDRTWAWDGGLAYQLLPPASAREQEQRYMVGISAGLGATTVNTSYVLTRTSLASQDTQHVFSALVRSRVTDDFTVAQSSVWTRRQFLGATLSDIVQLHTDAILRSDPGVLTSSLKLTHDVITGRNVGLAFGVNWAGVLTPNLQLALNTTLHLINPSERWRAELGLRYVFGDQRVLITKVAGQARADQPFALTFELGFAVPLQIPIGRRSDIGRLEGSITRPDGHGLFGAIVTVAGQAVTTTREGTFRFPALPIGTHQVRVVTAGGLAATEYLAPDLPATVRIANDATSELHFVVREAATVTGKIITEAVDPATSSSAIAPPRSAADLTRGVRIELRNEVTMLHTVTDANGTFRFQSVPVGTWTLHVQLPRTAIDYRIDPLEVHLSLEAGGHEDVLVRLVPIVRHIQFVDGGTLKPE